MMATTVFLNTIEKMDYQDYKAGQKETTFWFQGKNHLIDVLMSKIAPDEKEKSRILNVGCGTGEELKVLKKYGDNYIIDINKNALDLVKKGLYKEKKVADATRIPYKNNSFDIAVSFDVFEHISNDKKAVAEIYRVLKKGGSLVFTVPAYPALFSSHDKALGHKRRYTKRMVKKLLHKKSSEVKLFSWNWTLFPLIASVRMLKKKSKPKLDHARFPKIIDKFLYSILKLENKCIKHGFSLPFGLSIVGFSKK